MTAAKVSVTVAPANGTRRAHISNSDAAEGPDIRALVDLLPPRLFRAHVGGGPDDDADSGTVRGDRGTLGRHVGRRRIDSFGQSKVQHLCEAVRRDLDVGRLQVAMDDAAIVRRLERLRDLTADRDDLADCERTGGQAFGERRPLDELEHECGHVPALLDAVDRADVRVIEGRERASLVLEPRPSIRVVREGVGQDLDRNRASEPGVVRAVHLAHAAGAEQRLDAEGPQQAAGREPLHRVRNARQWSIAERPCLVVSDEHRDDVRAQRDVVAAGLVQVRVARGPIEARGRGEDAADITPAIRVRVGSFEGRIIPEIG